MNGDGWKVDLEGQRIRSYRCQDVDEAPEDVGLYAWYARLDAGPPDWNLDLQNGLDAGVPRFRSLLKRHSERFVPAPIALTGRSPFSATWSGSLESDVADLFNALEGHAPDGGDPCDPDTTYRKRRAERLMETTASPELREALVQTLAAATPFLTSPIYIGVTKHLRTRLGRHRAQLLEEAAALRKDPGRREALLKSSDFGARAAAAGFSASELVVWTVNLTQTLAGVTDRERQRVVAEAGEWLLNRWHRPLLGRR